MYAQNKDKWTELVIRGKYFTSYKKFILIPQIYLGENLF